MLKIFKKFNRKNEFSQLEIQNNCSESNDVLQPDVQNNCEEVCYKNIIEIYDNEKKELLDADNSKIDGLIIKINGENNKIILHRPFKLQGCTLVINGNNNVLDIGVVTISISQTYFCMEPRADNRIIKIGDRTYIGQAKLMCFGSHNQLIIGKDCLLSSGIHIRTGDSHAIIDHTTKKLLNKNGDVFIGDHCWFGVDSFVNKNVKIANNTIIGAKAAIFKSFFEEYTAVGGVPAKVIKRNVEWLLQSDESYFFTKKINGE